MSASGTMVSSSRSVGVISGSRPGLTIGAVTKGVVRQERQVVAHVLERRGLVLDDLVDVAALGLHVGTAQLVEGHVLAGDVLDHVGAGDEHVTLVAHRHQQVSLDRRIDRSPSAFAQDDGDLRHQTTQHLVPAAQLGVPRQRGDRVLDSGAGRVVDADDRAADHGHPVHQLGHLAAEHLADRALEHRLVVAEHRDRPAVDPAMPGDHAVAVERVRVTRRAGQGADLQEAARVEQRVNAGAGARDALLVAPRDCLRITRLLGQLQLLAQFGQQLGGGLGGHLALLSARRESC